MAATLRPIGERRALELRGPDCRANSTNDGGLRFSLPKPKLTQEFTLGRLKVTKMV